MLDGRTFEPVAEAIAELLLDGDPVRMRNVKWQNPLSLTEQARGRFSFWPAPVRAEGAGVSSTFDLEVFVHAAGYDDSHHHFSINADSTGTDAATPAATHEVDNLVLFSP